VDLAVGILLFPLVVVWALPLLSDAISGTKVLLGARGRTRSTGPDHDQRLLILVPAHNESGQIAPCVRSILAQRPESGAFSLIVVADNCTDDTAQEARTAGATAWERFNPEQPGKPRAIQWALDQCRLDEFDAVVIIDADTEVREDYVEQLLRSGRLRDRVAQTYYGVQSEERSWVNTLAGLLVASKYEGQYHLRAQARLNAPMTGNGMCIGTGVLERCGWADDALTENWEMYTRYTLAGERIDLVTEARLEALEPTTMGESSVRRQRWQAGKWGVLRDYAGRLFSPGAVGLHQRIDLLAELLSPGPVAHAGIAFALGGGLLAWSPTPLIAALGIVLLLSPLPTIVWTIHAIIRHPQPGQIAIALVRLPVYLAWRITIIGRALPTYLSGVWQRSPRPGDSSRT
jgi:cellulose synthase/poly-beta-1,6-N-acetylglucosamine synthase-like glycosyltransferase